MLDRMSIKRKIIFMLGVILIVFIVFGTGVTTISINWSDSYAQAASDRTNKRSGRSEGFSNRSEGFPNQSEGFPNQSEGFSRIRFHRGSSIIYELKKILDANPELKKALEESIRKANRLEAPTLKAFYEYLDEMVTWIPEDREVLPKMLEFYYLINQSPDDILQKDELFQQWTVKFAKEWGNFLNTTQSARDLKKFYTDPRYHIDDYIEAPGGWLTYNQFFARHVKPGKRPIDGLCDDSVIVSPADSVFHGQWKVDEDSQITAKGLKWSINELLDGSPFKDRFKGGTYMHMFLNVNDYHRYHVPVGGVVREVRQIPGKVVFEVNKKEDGSLEVVDGDTFQFSQARGLIIIDSPVGLVAVLPIGMAQVSSVNLTAEVGVTLAKGEEFGYFLFGGSDIVVIFEADRVQIKAEVGKHYKQGETIATAVK